MFPRPEFVPYSCIIQDIDLVEALPRLAAEKYHALCADLGTRGIMDSLKCARLKDGTVVLLDGHHRLEWWMTKGDDMGHPIPLCQIVPGIRTKLEGHLWILQHQRDRRNQTEKQTTYDIGVMLRLEVAIAQERGDMTVPMPEAEVVKKVAADQEVTPQVARRSKQFANAVDHLATIDPKLAEDIMAARVPISELHLIKIAKMETPEKNAAIHNLKAGRKWNDAGIPVEPVEPKSVETAVEQRFREAQLLHESLVKTCLPGMQNRLVDLGERFSTGTGAKFPLPFFRDLCEQIYGGLSAWKPGAICPDCNGKKCVRCEQRGFKRLRTGGKT